MNADKPEYRSLPVDLTSNEVSLKGEELAKLAVEYCDREIEIKEERKAMADELKKLRKGIDEIALIVKTKREMRNVKCIWTADWARKTWTLHREDTGEVIEVQKMSKGDMQEKIVYGAFGEPIDENSEEVPI